MKQIKYDYTGGLPLSQNVLEFSQNGLRDLVAGILQGGYESAPVIISGCLYDSGTGDITAGWVFDGTEAHYFAGGNTVTAGTSKIKVAETTSTVVFDDGSVRAIYRTKQYVFDNTGTDILNMKRYGLTAISSGITCSVTEAAGTLFVQVNKLTRMMHITGQIDTLTAAALASDGLYVKLIDDSVLEADPVFGPYYPKNTCVFTATVLPVPGGTAVYADTHSVPITSIPIRLDNSGLWANLRKTGSGQYPMVFDAHIFID